MYTVDFLHTYFKLIAYQLPELNFYIYFYIILIFKLLYLYLMKRLFIFLLGLSLVGVLGIGKAFATEGGIPLIAGQNTVVGEVTIDGNDVTYTITEDGWCIMETHLAIGKTLTDIPKTKTGNPIPGHFEYSDTHDCLDTVPYTDVLMLGDNVIAAHAVVEKRMCEPMKVAPYGADIISDYWQGRRYDGTEVKSIRSNPLTVLSYEIGHNEAYFFSLGFEFQPTEGALIPNGGIIVEFETPILNGVGDDLQIVEDTWGLPYPDETANVYVSNDATNWTYLGEADNQTPSSLYHTVSNFDLGSLTSARYVKVENTSVKENFSALYPAQKDTLDGYDLNAILALHDNQNCIIDSETAWADGTRFVPKGNWATFFNYPLEQDYELLETVFVPATSNVGIDSVNILVDGKQYILKASGFYKFANWTG